MAPLQNSVFNIGLGEPENAIYPPITNDFSLDTCFHTSTTDKDERAWWMFQFSFGFAYITDIIIYYREGLAVRMDGFKVYVTNTSRIPPDGYLCYEDPDPGLPNITQTIPCHKLGKYIIYYDIKGSTELSMEGTVVYGPIVELCYVAINDNVASDGLVYLHPSGNPPASVANDGNRTSCSKIYGVNVTVQVDLMKISIGKGMFVTFGALDKKQETCQKQHIQYEMKPGKNFVIEFSTAAFEATKNFLLSHFTSENFNNNLAVKEQKNLDSTHITVDHSYRIYNRKNNGQIGSKLKYVVNVYNTTSLINVNGSRVELFVNGIFKDLCAYLSKHFDSFDILNNEIANYLEDISANYKDKDRNLGNSASSILKGKSRQPTVGTSTTCRLALSPSPSPQVLDISSGSPKSTPIESSISKPLTEICPMCSEFVVEEGIACDKCNFWLHFECTGINKDKTNLNSIQGEDFICMLCNNDLLYEDRNTNETLCQVTQDNEDIHSDSILSNLSIIDPSSNTHKQLNSNSPAINSSNDAKGELGHPTVGLSTTSCPDFPLATASDTSGSQNENQVNIPINAEIIKPKTTKRAYKTKDEKEDIIINQKTRILNL
ncbi:unnamed protein product [Mytilus edulis]|uniref:PHD-type domain-containing protein n=1 Tax=Mytilus edulis TaxID=6550 RepID=A0A8S3QSN4_MYTED|nr:unnamed protein product [Mytilus edulis]